MHVHCTHNVHKHVQRYMYYTSHVQAHNDESQEAFKDSGYFSKISYKSIGATAIPTH